MSRADRVDEASRAMREAEGRIEGQKHRLDALRERGMIVAAGYAHENLVMMTERLVAIRLRHAAMMETARLHEDIRCLMAAGRRGRV